MEDRLSSLPDDIISKILLNLNTKEVLRTGILSKGWKSAWEKVPALKLCHDDFKLKGESHYIKEKVQARFTKFVDRVLVARKSPRLEKVIIKTSRQIVDGNVMISWIRAAIERHVSELDIDFIRQGDIGYTPFELTHAVVACNKLSVLKLSAYMILYIPTASSSFFPYLKYLKLYDVSFKDDLSFENLLSNCPKLEDLLIVRPRWQYMGTSNITCLETLTIRSRSLKTLLVDSTFEEPENEVTFEEPENEVKVIKIDAPALESIEISCKTSKKFIVKDLPRLVEAKLDLPGVSSFCLYMFLTKISHVKSLTLKPKTTQSLVLAGSGSMPIFHNLTRLNLYGVNCDYDQRMYHEEWAVMRRILENSPKLETLILQNYARLYGERRRSMMMMKDWDVPNYLLSRLKTLKINFNDDSKTDGVKIQYLLTYAQALKKMTVRSRSYRVSRMYDFYFRPWLSPRIRDSVIWSDMKFNVLFP